jgi:hypothetical protein
MPRRRERLDRQGGDVARIDGDVLSIIRRQENTALLLDPCRSTLDEK